MYLTNHWPIACFCASAVASSSLPAVDSVGAATTNVPSAIKLLMAERVASGDIVVVGSLGLEPKDYDVATDAPPEWVTELFKRTRAVGKAFGVMHVYDKRHTVEVATFRSEGAYTDKRRPDRVTFADARADAQRRDFTINALFIDPLDRSEGEGGRVIDHVGGLADLGAGIVRAVGDPDERLAEDHLRALRAARFTARLSFRLDDATAAAVKRHASELLGVSRERIGDECRAMLTHPRRAAAVSLMQALGLDGPALGEDSLAHAPTRSLEAVGREASFPLALSAWALDRIEGTLGRAPTPGEIETRADQLIARWREALCLTNDERTEMRQIVEGVAALEGRWGEWGVAGRKRAGASAWFEPALGLIGVRDAYRAGSIRRQVRDLSADGIGLAPGPFLTGDDLIAAGLTPGPKFGKWLDQLYDMQLEGRVDDRRAALEIVMRWASGLAS